MKLTGFDFWKKTLNSAKLVVAPMVDQSELAWRILSRRHGAELCYTPMLNSKMFVKNPKIFLKEFQTCPEDHPLIAQFCGDDPEQLLEAAQMVEDQCEGIDLNLGCPQNIAKRGHYGSFLQDEWPLIKEIIQKLHNNLRVPVTVKIRIFPELEKTIRYAKMIEEAGAQILTIHGRTREQRGQDTGLADWDHIEKVRKELSIPVFANGNILYKDDIDSCIKHCNVQGVMTAEGNLYNPAIFEDTYYESWVLAEEYLEICKEILKKYSITTNLGCIRGHLFKIYRQSLSHLVEERQQLGESHNFDAIFAAHLKIKEKLMALSLKEKIDPKFLKNFSSNNLSLVPHWISRSFIRPPKHVEVKIEKEESDNDRKKLKIDVNK